MGSLNPCISLSAKYSTCPALRFPRIIIVPFLLLNPLPTLQPLDPIPTKLLNLNDNQLSPQEQRTFSTQLKGVHTLGFKTPSCNEKSSTVPILITNFPGNPLLFLYINVPHTEQK